MWRWSQVGSPPRHHLLCSIGHQRAGRTGLAFRSLLLLHPLIREELAHRAERPRRHWARVCREATQTPSTSVQRGYTDTEHVCEALSCYGKASLVCVRPLPWLRSQANDALLTFHRRFESHKLLAAQGGRLNKNSPLNELCSVNGMDQPWLQEAKRENKPYFALIPSQWANNS